MMRGLVVAGACAAVVAGPCGAAWAEETVEIQPDPVYQGSRVDISISLLDCVGTKGADDFDEVVARSPAFARKVYLDREEFDFEGAASVRAGTRPGRYKVTVDCPKDRSGYGYFYVRKVKRDKKVVYRTIYRNGTPYTTPVGPATGGGWLASRRTADNAGNGTMVLGAAGVIALAGGGLWLRRRRNMDR